MKKYAIIVAAGAGKRFNPDSLKQFAILSGKPMLMHSIQAFFNAEPGIDIIIVIPEHSIFNWNKLCRHHNFNIPHRVVRGGPERFHSVKNGLQLTSEEGLVAIHDGARPLVSASLILHTFDMAGKFGAVVPVIEIHDSVRMADAGTHKPVDRKKLRIVQTPQVFKTGLVKKAYAQAYDPSFTDDATVVEAAGERIRLVNGSRDNMKITFPEDISIAEAIIEVQKAQNEQ